MSSSDLLELSKEDLVARIRKLQDQAGPACAAAAPGRAALGGRGTRALTWRLAAAAQPLWRAQADHDRRRADGLAEELKQAKEHNVAVVSRRCTAPGNVRNETAHAGRPPPAPPDALPPCLCLLPQQKQVEQEEEFITNKLMKRLEQLKREKAVLASEVGTRPRCVRWRA